MKYLNLKKYFTYVCLLSLVACSGGEGGTGLVATDKDVAIGSLQSTQGNSILVNGVNFDAASASISVDGNVSDTSFLKSGMIVNVTGAIDASGTSGVADIVSTKNLIKGIVENVNPFDF